MSGERLVNHVCTREFKTDKIDQCLGTGFDRCFGDEGLTLEIYFTDTNGHEEMFDNWQQRHVNYCPFCGYKAKVQVKD